MCDPYHDATELGAPNIHLHPGMRTRKERSVLVHELVHVEHDEQPTPDTAWGTRR